MSEGIDCENISGTFESRVLDRRQGAYEVVVGTETFLEKYNPLHDLSPASMILENMKSILSDAIARAEAGLDNVELLCELRDKNDAAIGMLNDVIDGAERNEKPALAQDIHP